MLNKITRYYLTASKASLDDETFTFQNRSRIYGYCAPLLKIILERNHRFHMDLDIHAQFWLQKSIDLVNLSSLIKRWHLSFLFFLKKGIPLFCLSSKNNVLVLSFYRYLYVLIYCYLSD